MKHTYDYSPYLIGFGWDVRRARSYARQRNWFGVRYTLKQMVNSSRRRSYWGVWQMEWPGCHRAVRGLTRQRTFERGAAGWLLTIMREPDGGEGAEPEDRGFWKPEQI